MHSLKCPCFSGKLYSDCCRNYHRGTLFPEDALKLMRSRYASYALNLPDYIVETTHPANPCYQTNIFNWKREISHFSKATSFENLEILHFSEFEDRAIVTFVAYLSQEGSDCSFFEKSYFEKLNGRWQYKRGHPLDQKPAIEEIDLKKNLSTT